MTRNNNRNGHFTSSEIHRLCASSVKGGKLKGFETYVEEVQLEIDLGRSTSTEINTQAVKWGSLMEVVLFDLLGLQYSMSHKETLLHPIHGAYWSGTPDLEVKGVKAGEIKCFQPLHFGQLSKVLLTKDTEKIKEQEPKTYWQTLSNASILQVPKAEIIAYMPYESELKNIIEEIRDTDFLERNGLNPSDYYFMDDPDKIDHLPWLPDNSKFSNINAFEFDVPEHDMKHMEKRVIEAGNLLKY